MEINYLPVIKSPEDDRDWLYSNFLSLTDTLPKTLDLRSQLMPIRNQGQQGTCAAQAAACMKEFQEKKEHNFQDYMSPQFIYNHRVYWNNNKLDGDDRYEDYGMTCRDIMHILKNIGICSESLYPYGTREYVKEIPRHIINAAKKYCIQGYSRIYNIEELKHALFNNGPCMIAFPIYHHGKDMWIQHNQNQQMLGGHVMTIVGYNSHGFIIRNTWGAEWGDKGYCLYPFTHWNSHWEIWTTIDAKTSESNQKPRHQPTPKPTPRPEPMPDPDSDSESEPDSEFEYFICCNIC